MPRWSSEARRATDAAEREQRGLAHYAEPRGGKACEAGLKLKTENGKLFVFRFQFVVKNGPLRLNREQSVNLFALCRDGAVKPEGQPTLRSESRSNNKSNRDSPKEASVTTRRDYRFSLYYNI